MRIASTNIISFLTFLEEDLIGILKLCDALHRTSLVTRSAARTLFVIDGCNVIHNGNSTVRTSLLALTTSNTSVSALLSRCRTAVVTRAAYGNGRISGNEGDDMLRTSLHTLSARDTLRRIHSCNTVCNADCTGGTYGGAIAASETSELTSVRSTANETHSSTGAVSVIVCLGGGNV